MRGVTDWIIEKEIIPGSNIGLTFPAMPLRFEIRRSSKRLRQQGEKRPAETDATRAEPAVKKKKTKKTKSKKKTKKRAKAAADPEAKAEAPAAAAALPPVSAVTDPAVLAIISAMQAQMKESMKQMQKLMIRQQQHNQQQTAAGTANAFVSPENYGDFKDFSVMNKGSSAYRVWKSVQAQWKGYIRPALEEKGVAQVPDDFSHMTEEFLREHFSVICEAPRLLKNLKAKNRLPARKSGEVLYSSGLRRVLQNLLLTWTKARCGRPRLIKDMALLDTRNIAINALMLKEPIRLPIRNFNPDEAKKIWDHMTAEPITVINLQRLMLYMVHVFLGLRTGRSLYKINAHYFGYSEDRKRIFFRGPTTKVKLQAGQKVKEVLHRDPIFVQTQIFNKLFLVYMELRGRCNPSNPHFFLRIKANHNVPILVALKEKLDVFEDAPITNSYQSNWLRALCKDAGVTTVDVVGRTLRNLHAIAQTRAGYAHTWKSTAIKAYLREHSDLGRQYVQVSGGDYAAGKVLGDGSDGSSGANSGNSSATEAAGEENKEEEEEGEE